jgi:hypothetical protein
VSILGTWVPETPSGLDYSLRDSAFQRGTLSETAMAYNSGQGGHGDSWTHQGYGGHATTSNHPWTGASRAPDQSFHVGAPATEPGDYDPNWSAGTFVNTPQLLGYDQHQQYSQPVLYKTSSMGSNAIPCNPVGTGAYYRSPGGHYSPSPNGPSGYQYVCRRYRRCGVA